MKGIPVKQLEAGSFQKYGSFADMKEPQTPAIGSPPCEFFRDMAIIDLGVSTSAALSVCRVAPRPAVIDCIEYHNHSGEGMMPLDGDVLLCFAPASMPGQVPLKSAEVFFVPRLTMVTIRRGVWHCAAYAVGSANVNILIVLPERTYVNDCAVLTLAGEEQLIFEQERYYV